MSAGRIRGPNTAGRTSARGIRAVCSVIALCAPLLAASATAAERLPIFSKNTSYDQARSSLVSLGWAPVAQATQHCDANGCYDRCARGSAGRCEAYPEAETCHEFGLASCGMIWRRGGALIEIRTFSADVPPYVDRVQCRSGC